MPSLTVDLTDEEDAFLERLVASGRFPSADEAAERGVRLLEQDEAEIAAFVEQVNRVHRRMQRGEFEPGLDDRATRRAFRAARRAWAAELAHSRWLAGREDELGGWFRDADSGSPTKAQDSG